MSAEKQPPAAYGRYLLFGEIASGGMGSVHFARLVGPRGFSRTVAIKKLHAFLAAEAKVVAMFVEEARLASRVRHPNVVPTLDVIEQNSELLIVMEYVEGEALSKLMAAAKAAEQPVPLPIVSRFMGDILHGLDAAHEAKGDTGKPLDIVHRDVSPQNVLIGIDGVARVVDFGIAKASDRVHRTLAGEVKGKLRYVAPEQLVLEDVDRRADVYAAGVILWELIVGQPMRSTRDVRKLTTTVTEGTIVKPSTLGPVPPRLEEVVLRALERSPGARFPYARQMADALHEAVPPASPAVVAAWVKEQASERLAERAAYVAQMATEAHVTVESPRAEDVITRLERPATPARARGVPRRWPVILAAIAATALVTLFALFAVVWMRPPIEAREPAPPSVAVLPDPVSSAAVGAVVSAAAASPSAEPKAVPGVRAPLRKRPAPPSHPDCRIPFTVDSSGVRIPRPECM